MENIITYHSAEDYHFNLEIPTLMILVDSQDIAVKLLNSGHFEELIAGYRFYALLYGNPSYEIWKYSSYPTDLRVADAKMKQSGYPWILKQIVL
jgi:hypothetical protein